MRDYPLEELGPRAFEQLAVALSLKVLGSGVEAFGSGPDGGREATYIGPVNWSATSGFGAGSWEGYVVIQAKQREHPSDPQGNATWLARQIEDEFDRWTSEESKRGKFPQYIIFVTNVRLSSTAGTGESTASTNLSVNGFTAMARAVPVLSKPADCGTGRSGTGTRSMLS